MHGDFLLKVKKNKILSHVFKTYLNNENLNTFGVIKKALFSLKKC